jgi:hypothetical protein
MILAGPLTLWEGVLPLRVGLSWNLAGLCHCALQRMEKGDAGEQQRLKPNCVLSNLSTEDSSPSPSRLPDKCRSRPPVCQGCLNWYQDVPGLRCPSCLLTPAAVTSKSLAATSTSRTYNSVHRPKRSWRPAETSTTQYTYWSATLFLEEAVQGIQPRKTWRDTEDRYRVHFHMHSLGGLKGDIYPFGKVLLRSHRTEGPRAR